MTCTQATHARLKRSTKEWQAATTLLGIQRFADDGPDVELRNCRCGSTLAREIRQEIAR